MRFSATLTAALGAMPLVANALPTTPRNSNGANAVRTYHPRDATPIWARNMQAYTVETRPAAGAGAVEAGAGAGAEAGNNKQKNKEKAAGEAAAEREDVEGNDEDDNEKQKQKNKEKAAGEGAQAGREGAAGQEKQKEKDKAAGEGAQAGREGAAGQDKQKEKNKDKDGAAGREGEAGAAEEVEVQGVFGQLVELKANVKTDVIFPGTAGSFEVEFQSKTAAKVAVIENKTPGPAPKGFKLLEASSFVVSMVGETKGAQRAQLDFIFNNADPAVAGLDLTKTTIGKFSAEKNIFEVGDKVGETEFEAEENEVVLKPRVMQGEFAVFVPENAAAAPPAAAPPVAAPPIANGTLPIPPPAAAPPAAGKEGGKEGEEKVEEEEIALTGNFGTPVDVVGGSKQQGIRFTEGQAGTFEVEFGGAAANKILVTDAAPTGKAPAGFVFVDRAAFTVKTEVASVEGDLLKIDYFFSAATEGLVDINQGRIGKLDAATGEYLVEGVGSFEIEAEEKEWTLTVTDLNGEWAILIPQAAVKNAGGAAAQKGGVAKAKHHQ